MPVTRRGFLGATGAAAAAPDVRGPNVLFIMADQLRFDAVGANGNRLIHTPNLDRLARDSANFAKAYVQAPVCVPSRISFFTGRYPHSHKNRVNYTPCDPRETMLQRYLEQAGYQTGSVGKLHYYPPTSDHARSTGFDSVRLDDGVSSTDRYSDYVRWRRANDPKAQLPYNALAKDQPRGTNPFRGAIDYRYTQTAWVGDQSVAMLKQFSQSQKPFFLHASFFKPHSPYTVPEPFDAMYNSIEIPLPRQVTLEYIQGLPLPVQRLILRGKQPPYAMDRERLQWIWRSYYGAVAMVDREVGRILDELNRVGKARETIVIFSTDHGDQLLEHGLEGKNVFFESSVRIPLMMRWPGRIRAGSYPELVETVDVLPTVMDLCGLRTPVNCQGMSLGPLVSGSGTYQAREAAFAENVIPEVITGGNLEMPFEPGRGVAGIRHPDAKMVRTKRWKLNYYPGRDGELYDLENDPDEFRNLYTDPAHKGTVREMRDRLLDWLITADENDQIAPHWLV